MPAYAHENERDKDKEAVKEANEGTVDSPSTDIKGITPPFLELKTIWLTYDACGNRDTRTVSDYVPVLEPEQFNPAQTPQEGGES